MIKPVETTRIESWDLEETDLEEGPALEEADVEVEVDTIIGSGGT